MTEETRRTVLVTIMPKPDILDPQGKAILRALAQLGFDSVRDARVGKVIELSLAEPDPDRALQAAESMAQKLLANGVIECFSVALVS